MEFLQKFITGVNAMSFNRMITKTTTYDELDEMMKNFRQRNVVAGSYIPSRNEIDNIIVPNFEKYIDYIYWLLETSKPETEEARQNKKYLMSLFSERVRIEEDVDAVLFLNPTKEKYEMFLRSLEVGNNLR